MSKTHYSIRIPKWAVKLVLMVISLISVEAFIVAAVEIQGASVAAAIVTAEAFGFLMGLITILVFPEILGKDAEDKRKE